MSRSTYIATAWVGRLVDQVGKRSWDSSEAYTGLRRLTAVLQCRTSEAEALRPAMGDAHPEFPLMLCDDRSIREDTSETGMTFFTVDYYGMRTAADEAIIFQPRVQSVLNVDQVMKISIRHLHVGRPLNVRWVALLALPRPQEMGSEFAALALSNDLSSNPLSMYSPRYFALQTRNVSEYGPYCVIDDIWTQASFYTDGESYIIPETAGIGGSREPVLDDDGNITSALQQVPYTGANRNNTFEMQLSRYGLIAAYANIPNIATPLTASQLAAARARALAGTRIGTTPATGSA